MQMRILVLLLCALLLWSSLHHGSCYFLRQLVLSTQCSKVTSVGTSLKPMASQWRFLRAGIQQGDICWDIAQANAITVAELESWNPDIDCTNLQIRQILCISDPGSVSPPPAPDICPTPIGACNEHLVVAGDSCWAISQTYGISLVDFESWNPGVCNNLQIKQIVCVSAPGSVDPLPLADFNGTVFMEYIGALQNGVSFSDVPINSSVDFYFILAFAIDYNSATFLPSNGDFEIFWQNSVLTPAAVQAIKAQNKNVKVMVSLGGDTVRPGQEAIFSPTSTSTWVSNAVSSLTDLVQQYDLDGIDINYEHFNASEEIFTSCIGQLITQLKDNGVISVTSIAPFNRLNSHYIELWDNYNSLIDYVNFQFYTFSTTTSAAEYVRQYNAAAAKYGGGSKVLASFNTAGNIGPPPATVLCASEQLQSNGRLPGIFAWSADGSFASNTGFPYEVQAQALLAASTEQQTQLSSMT